MKFFQEFAKPLWLDGKNFVLDTLFPIRCFVCEKENKNFICESCEPQLKRLEQQFCIVCQKPTIGGITHPKCKTPLLPDGLISMLDYHDAKVAEVLIKGKYKFIPDVYKIFGRMLSQLIRSDFPHLFTFDPCLVPLPLHTRRLRWRGFNQAESLCQTLSQELNLPPADVLIRAKSTKIQKDLKKAQRITNVEDAFKLRVGADIHGKNLILIDDVTTTGSTLLEAAKVLKRNGAEQVWCLTVAKD